MVARHAEAGGLVVSSRRPARLTSDAALGEILSTADPSVGWYVMIGSDGRYFVLRGRYHQQARRAAR